MSILHDLVRFMAHNRTKITYGAGLFCLFVSACQKANTVTPPQKAVSVSVLSADRLGALSEPVLLPPKKAGQGAAPDGVKKAPLPSFSPEIYKHVWRVEDSIRQKWQEKTPSQNQNPLLSALMDADHSLLSKRPPSYPLPSLVIRNEGKVSGFAGCNSFYGFTQTSQDSPVINIVAMSQMACLGPAMVEEEAYLAALGAVRTLRVRKGLLYALDAKGQTVLVFRPEDQEPR